MNIADPAGVYGCLKQWAIQSEQTFKLWHTRAYPGAYS